MARPTKLSPVVIKRLVNAFKKGASVEAACAIACIAESTYYDWMKQGREGVKGFAEFLEHIKKAQAFAEMRAIAAVVKASEGFPTKIVKTKTKTQTRIVDGVEVTETETETVTTEGRQFAWQAGAWLLERKYPDRWGRTERRDEEAEEPTTGISWERLTEEDVEAARSKPSGDRES